MDSGSPEMTHAEPAPASRGRRGIVRLGRFLIGLLALLITLGLVGLAYQAIATANDQRRFPAPGQLVDVGGYRMHLFSMGENHDSPTVVLLACGGCTSSNWGWVQPAIARTTRVVAYDRAGFGWSDPGPGSRDALQHVHELHTALERAGIPGPYLLVGHSYGGEVARVFAGQYPTEVTGMVLIDPRHPDQSVRFPADALEKARDESRMIAIVRVASQFGLLRLTDMGKERELPQQQNDEYNAFHDTTRYWESIANEAAAIDASDAASRAVTSLGALPLAVLSADQAWWTPNAPADETRLVYTKLNQEQAALSANSVHRIVAGASHTSLVNNRDDAQAIIDAILDVLNAAHSGQPLAR